MTKAEWRSPFATSGLRCCRCVLATTRPTMRLVPVIAGLVPGSHVLPHRTHRTINAGTLLYTRTSLAWLPSTKRPKPRRP